MAISYTHPATQETTTKELWSWVALYNNGTQLEQFELSDKGAIFHRSAEIEASKLIELQFIHATHPAITIAVPPEATPVHFYRHKWVIEQFIDTDTMEHLNREWRIKIWCLGFRIKSTYWLAFTDEYNHTIFTSDKEMFINRALPGGVK